jgi:hypothetical protein
MTNRGVRHWLSLRIGHLPGTEAAGASGPATPLHTRMPSEQDDLRPGGDPMSPSIISAIDMPLAPETLHKKPMQRKVPPHMRRLNMRYNLP